jgi:ABC-type tungstate transport system substrate-binding protein
MLGNYRVAYWIIKYGTRCSIVVASSRKVKESILVEVITFLFKLHYPFISAMALGFARSLTEMRTRNIPGGEMFPARKADNLTPNCESIF